MNAKHDGAPGTDHDEPVDPGDSADEVIDEPVLDGSEDHSEGDIDPRKGMSDPALIRDIESGKKTVNPYG